MPALDRQTAGSRAQSAGRRSRFITHGEQLGTGAYGSVFLGIKDGDTLEQVAIKAIAPMRMKPHALTREAEILQRLSDDAHPTALRFHGYLAPQSLQLSSARGVGIKGPGGCSVPVTDCHCLVMEAVRGVELFSHVVDAGGLTEAEAAPLMAQLAEGTLRAHLHGIVHRDIKLENVLYVAARGGAPAAIKLIDWGLAHTHTLNADGSVQPERLHTRCGSRSYMAPEVAACRTHGAGYDGFAADVWSLGISLFAMVMGFFPLESADPEADWRAREVRDAQRAGRSTVATIFGFYPSKRFRLSAGATALIDAMLRFDPAERCSLDAVLGSGWLAPFVQPLPQLAAESDRPPCWLPPLTPRATTPVAAANANANATRPATCPAKPKQREPTQSPATSVSDASSCGGSLGRNAGANVADALAALRIEEEQAAAPAAAAPPPRRRSSSRVSIMSAFGRSARGSRAEAVR